MKQHPIYPYLNLSGSIYDHRDYITPSSQYLGHAYPPSIARSHLAPSHSSYLQIHSKRIISALKRDRIKTQNDELSRYGNNSCLFPQSGMSHKRYIAEIQNKFMTSATKFMTSDTNHDEFSLNHSAGLQYSFTEYQKIKAKIKEKNRGQDQWLESELQRMKNQDQLIEIKERMNKKTETPYFPLKIQQNKKVKDIFNQLREQLKPPNDKTNDSNLSDKKHKKNQQPQMKQSFVQQSQISPTTATKVKNLSTSQVMSSDSKSKKSQRHQKNKKNALKQMISHHIPINPTPTQVNDPTQLNDRKNRKSQPRDRYLYVSNQSNSELDNSSMFKSQYQNKYDYLMERPSKKRHNKTKMLKDQKITDQMIDNAFVFDALNECHSDYEKDPDGQVKFRKKQNKYKDSLQVVYNKLYKTPEREKEASQILVNNSNNQSSKGSGKQDRRYNDLLVSIQRKKLQAKPFAKSYLYPQTVIKTSQKHLSSSLNQDSPQSNHQIQNQSKPQQIKAYPNEMQIYNNRSTHQQYPVFSPYTQHKQLTHEYLTASLERKKLPKLNGTLKPDKKQQNNFYVRDLIVDEIEKKKIAKKQQLGHEKSHGVAINQTKHHHVEHIATVLQKQRQQHNLSQNNHNHIPPLNHSQLHHANRPTIHSQIHRPPIDPTIHPFPIHPNSSQAMAKTLKIELQILKQQLQDKNRKVIDLEIQLMQIKNSLRETKEEKEDQATTTKSRIPNEDSRKDVTFFKDTESQTQNATKLSADNGVIKEFVMPDDKLTKEHHQQLSIARNHVKLLQNKLELQQQTMTNLFEDLGMYQKLNDQLQNKIKVLEKEKHPNK